MHLWLTVLLIAVMGTVLGLLGGGGSILTVPILVYALDLEAHSAIVHSLVLVGSASLVGVWVHQKYSLIAWKQGLLFVAFGAPLNFLGSRFSHNVSATLLLLFFGLLMCVSGAAMLLKRADRNDSLPRPKMWPVIVSGAAVGFLAGFLGVGGGFIIVPSLVMLLRMPIKAATGTSLLVIAANSAVALFGHRRGLNLDWTVLSELLPCALVATYAGVQMARHLSALLLRKLFGVFVILLGVVMIVNNLAALGKR